MGLPFRWMLRDRQTQPWSMTEVAALDGDGDILRGQASARNGAIS